MRVRDDFGGKVERLEGAQDCSHGWSPDVPGRNPWILVKKMDPPRQGRRKLGIVAFLRPFRAGTAGWPRFRRTWGQDLMVRLLRLNHSPTFRFAEDGPLSQCVKTLTAI